MILIPSLELLDGELVRLAGDIESTPKVLHEDPVSAARDLRRAGAMFLHIVDLDAVYGTSNNDEVLRRLSDDMIPFQVRGGVRTAERANALLELGADRVVLGDLPYRDPTAAASVVEAFGLRVMGTLDVQASRVIAGRGEFLDLDRAMSALRVTGLEHVIYNSVESAGEDAPLDIANLERVLSNDGLHVHVRCTVRNSDELDPVVALLERGLRGVILNHALAAESASFESLVGRCGACVAG